MAGAADVDARLVAGDNPGMKIQTFTVIVGTTACNARCPYCVSRMTPSCGVGAAPIPPNTRNFEVACRFARSSGVSTVLLTGKGEPTLFPAQISEYVTRSQAFGFPFIEMQTNGIRLAEDGRLEDDLRAWYRAGLTTVSVSIAHPDPDRNAEIFRPGRPYDPWALVEKLHRIGLAVRVNCTLVKGYVDRPAEVASLVDLCRERRVEQLTVREVTRPEESEDPEASGWVAEHGTEGLCEEVRAELDRRGSGATRLLELPHGGLVYDWRGQNLCLGNCLTGSTDPEDIRQLIFFPDGHLRYDWRYPGAIIL
jgi:molybdenum cofactor biosynthesis enzyme MoaA